MRSRLPIEIASRVRDVQAGFSLAEIALVLLVAGLMTGTVLAAHALIVQAQVKEAVQEFNLAFAALHTYQDRYAALPGDDSWAGGRWVGHAKSGTGDGLLSGAFEDLPPPGDPLAVLTVDGMGGETLNFWWHLRLAGIIHLAPSSANPALPPPNGFAGILGVQQSGLGFSTLISCQSNLPDRIAVGIDSQLDDGSPFTGQMHGALQTSTSGAQALYTTVSVPAYEENGTNRYTLCQRM